MDNITAQPEAVQNLAQPEATQEASQPTAVETVTNEASQPEFKAKYNKEEKVFSSWDEARPFVEKGMNYDKLKERLQSIEPELEQVKQYKKFFEDAAAELGVTPEEAKARFEKQRLIARAQKENKPVAQLEAEVRADKAEAKAKQIETEQQKRGRKAIEWQEFQTAFPDVKADDIPEDVFAGWRDGDEPLSKLYKLHKYDLLQTEYAEKTAALEERIKLMEQKATAQQINAENAESAPQKLGGGDTGHGELTMADIDKMTPAEIEKNIDKIWAVYTKQ